MSAMSIVFGVGVAMAQTATTAGAVTTPYPTTQAISIAWAITGDSNNNGSVSVRYRKQGAAEWQTGMALARVPADENTTGDFGSGGGTWGNHHAGSLFDLAPQTTYEIELSLTDPDGGGVTANSTATTRPIPVAASDALIKQVTTSTFASAIGAAAPGDVFVLAAGSYPSFTMSRNGSAGKPIVIRGSSVDGVIFGGRVTLSDRQWVYLEDVTVNGEVRMNGASNMVVRGCKIRTTSSGITFQVGDAIPRNNYIVDNDVVGAATWVNDQLGADGYNSGEGIELTGSGHVVCWNHVKGFRDDISLMEYDEAYEQVSIDICNNDLEEATDDAIEADSAMGNVRVLRNRITNCFDGISAQPNLGGPSYYVRNVMYNVLYSPFKFHNGTVGDVVLHNTVVKCGDGFGCYAGETWKRAFFRNNIFIGGTGAGTYGGYANGSGRVLDLVDADATCSFDYDGLGSIGTGKFEGRIGDTRFTSVATMQSNTTEAHGLQVEMSVFAAKVTFPSNPFPPGPPPDLRLADGSAAVDKGVAIAGIGGFSASAPDLGAYELGAVLPVYGPRTVGGTVPVGMDGGVDGGSGTGGATGRGGSGAIDGAPGTGGVVGSGGLSGSGGKPGPGGSSGSGGKLGTGNVPGSGGMPGLGGAVASGGGMGLDGAIASGGRGSLGDAGASSGGASTVGDALGPTAQTADHSGCSCKLGNAHAMRMSWLLLALAALLGWRRR